MMKTRTERVYMYDYLIVGAGLFGAVFAREATKSGNKVLVIDKRPHIGGNVYTEKTAGVNVHKYGAHIFHTNNKSVWEYALQYACFNRFTNSPVASYLGELYSLPFNMYTFNHFMNSTYSSISNAMTSTPSSSHSGGSGGGFSGGGSGGGGRRLLVKNILQTNIELKFSKNISKLDKISELRCFLFNREQSFLKMVYCKSKI